jgi:hypothetical protein
VDVVEAVAVPVSEESMGLYNRHDVPSQEMIRGTNPIMELEASAKANAL